MRQLRERVLRAPVAYFAGRWRLRCRRSRFMEETPDAKVEKYRGDLTFFMKLRAAVKQALRRGRRLQGVRGQDSEADRHARRRPASVEKVTTLVNIFDKDAFLKEVEKLEGTASKADTIAHRTKKTIERADGRRPGLLPQVLRDAGRRDPGLPREAAGRPRLPGQGDGDRRRRSATATGDDLAG